MTAGNMQGRPALLIGFAERFVAPAGPAAARPLGPTERGRGPAAAHYPGYCAAQERYPKSGRYSAGPPR
jgi:hypothetical protein